MRALGDRRTTTAIPDDSQQPYWPSGHAVGVRDPTPIETPGPLGIPRAASPMETSLSFFIPFLGQTPIHPGAQRPQVQGKRAGVQVSEPDTPVLPPKDWCAAGCALGAGRHEE